MFESHLMLNPLGVVSRLCNKNSGKKVKNQNVNCKIVEAFRHLFRIDFSAPRGQAHCASVEMTFLYCAWSFLKCVTTSFCWPECL
jgi:hypothetical protein